MIANHNLYPSEVGNFTRLSLLSLGSFKSQSRHSHWTRPPRQTLKTKQSHIAPHIKENTLDLLSYLASTLHRQQFKQKTILVSDNVRHDKT